MRWRMHKRTEQKEDGRWIYYYTFTPAEPSRNPLTDALSMEYNRMPAANMLFRAIQWLRRCRSKHVAIRSKIGQLEQIAPLARAVRQVWEAASAADRTRLLQGIDPRLRLMMRVDIHSPQALESAARLASPVIEEDIQAEQPGPPVGAIRAIYLAEAQRLVQFEWTEHSPTLDQALLNLQQALNRFQAV